jgi:hypothetical protein
VIEEEKRIRRVSGRRIEKRIEFRERRGEERREERRKEDSEWVEERKKRRVSGKKIRSRKWEGNSEFQVGKEIVKSI